MRVADAVWTATALLHKEQPAAEDFEVQEIVSRAVREKFVGGFRPGLQPHTSWHCVANKKPNGGRYRMLFETTRGRRRLLRTGDSFHPDRDGEIRPEKSTLPPELQSLVDWYDAVYSKQGSSGSRPETTQSEPGAIRSRSNPTMAYPPLDDMQFATAFVNEAGAVVIPETLRRELGIGEGTRVSIHREKDHLVLQPITKEFISSLVGSCKGQDSLLEAWQREHRKER